MILFSIIIPHFNTPDLLGRLIDSIPVSEDTEVIVIDDNSTLMIDEYSELRREYSARGVIFLQNSTGKRSAGICRNIGINKASGKWVIFADSDDYFTKDFRKIIENNSNSSEDVIFFFPTSCDSDTGECSNRHIEFVNILQSYINNRTIENELQIRYSLVAPWAKMIKRQFLLRNNILFEGTTVANDVLFCRKLGLSAEKIAVSEEVLYVVTTRAGSLTTVKNVSSFKIRLDVFIRSTKYLRKNLDRESYKKAHINGSYFIHKCKVEKLGIVVLIRTIFTLIINGISPINN